MDFTNQNLTRKAYLQNSPRNEQGKEREPKLYKNTASASAMPYGDVYRQIYVENFLLA